MTKTVFFSRVFFSRVPTGEVCAGCECEILMVVDDDGVCAEVTCDCGSALALCA
jgi:hypothetical protein